MRFYDKALTNHRSPEYLAAKKEAEKSLREQTRLAYLSPEEALKYVRACVALIYPR